MKFLVLKFVDEFGFQMEIIVVVIFCFSIQLVDPRSPLDQTFFC